jgi:hypothetical protein
MTIFAKSTAKKGAALGLLFIMLFSLSGCGTRKTSFTKPDIKDDFCGIVMNYQYCKCAFHNEFCDSVGLSPSTANWYVRSEYERWLKFIKDQFASDCRKDNGRVKGNSCLHCDPPNVWDGDNCINPENTRGVAERESQSFQADGPLENDCNIKEGEFASEWQKYSDFDDRIPYESRSWEVQNYLKAQEKLINLKVENFKLQRDMEIDRQIRIEAREFRKRLVENQRNNLIKATIRMIYLTYTTVKAGSSAGKSFEKFLTGSEVLVRAGGLLSTIKTVIPNDSRLAIDTNSIGGKVTNIGLSTALAAMENLGNPKDIATTFMTESRNSVMPSANLSDDEIAILRDHYIVKKHVDFAIADSYEVNKQRRKQVIANNQEIAKLNAEIAAWETAEKARVKDLLKYQCEENKKKYENEDE